MQYAKGRIRLLCKGADSVIFRRLAKGDPIRDITDAHLHVFGSSGLRTLCVAVADLSQDRFDAWYATFREASLAMDDREAKVISEWCGVM